MTSQPDIDLIRSLEEWLFKPSVRRSPEAVDALLADDFIEFGRSGRVYDKKEVVMGLASEAAETTETLVADDFNLKRLADGIVLLTYRSLRTDAAGEESHSLRSSIWRFMDGRWRMVFHQGTPADLQSRL